VEVIEDVGGERYLFLDGLMNLNQGGLDVLNHYIATVPAQLVRPHHALMIGNGTLSSVPRLYPLTGRLTSVELDAGVLAAGRRFFTSGRALEGLERWRLVVDDGKHFLRSTQDRFDLVIVDVPSPFTIQEGCLYTVEFYRLVRERLTERGVVSVQLSGQLRRNNDTAAQVTAALRQVFPEVLVVFSEEAERGFAYASPRLPFDAADVRAAAGPFEGRLALIPPSGVDAYLVEATPFAVDQMDTVLRRGWERFVNRYFDD
jgi:spermidine synthase